jgi:pimeloyl-ACP methyl ester carboxylesterase
MDGMDQTVKLAHEVRGDGPPLLLLAGTGYAGGTWSETMLEPLSERFTVITIDYRGTGGTPGTDGDYSTRLFAADAMGVLDTLGLPWAHVLGHSMGGRVGQWAALDFPERVRSLVQAASGPGEYRPGKAQPAGIPVAVALALAEKGYERYIGDQIRTTFFTPRFVADRPDVVEGLIAAFWAHRPALADYLKHVAARQGHRTVERIPEIGQPALVLVGEADTHIGGTGSHFEQSQWLAATLPRATLRTIPDEAHGYFWCKP